MTEHPLHSDKDNYIRNLEARIEELEQENCILQEDNKAFHSQRKKRSRQRLKAFVKVLLLLAIVSPLVTGGGYWVHSCNADWERLHERCSKLCELAIGDLSLQGYFSANETCNDRERHCKCRTRHGRMVFLPRTPRRELGGDLYKLVQKMDVATWKYCMNIKNRGSVELECSHIPWIVNLNGKAEQN